MGQRAARCKSRESTKNQKRERRGGSMDVKPRSTSLGEGRRYEGHVQCVSVWRESQFAGGKGRRGDQGGSSVWHGMWAGG